MTKESTSSTPVDQSESRVARFFDIFLLGFTIVVGGQPFSWNFGMNATFVEFICGTAIMGLSYFLLTFCVAEMISALPFSGGLYAFSRVALSPYAGFIVGLLEILHNAFTVASCVYPVAQALTFNLETDEKYEPAYWVVIIAICLYGNVIGGRTFWFLNKYMALASISIVILYFFTPTVNPVDFQKFAMSNLQGEKDHNFNWDKFFQYMPMGIWFFLGIELVPFASAYTIKPSHTIPRAMIASLTCIFIGSMITMFICCSQAPGTGALTLEFMPLTPGFSKFLNISPKAADWLSIPLMLPSIYGFFFGGGRQIWALSTSGLLPAFLKITTPKTEAPYVALLAEAIFVYIIMVIIKFGCDNNVMYFFYLYVLNSAVVYLTTFTTFIAFRQKYSNIKRHYISPLGNYGAYAGIIINLVCIGSILGLQEGTDFIVAPVSLVIFLILGSIYYFAYASNKQTFSPEEQKAFWITYVINSNTRAKKKPKSYANNSNPSTNRGRENSQTNRSNRSNHSNQSSERKSISFETFEMSKSKVTADVNLPGFNQANTNLDSKINDADGHIDFSKLEDIGALDDLNQEPDLEDGNPAKESLFPIHEHPAEGSHSHKPGASFLFGGSLFKGSLKNKILPTGSGSHKAKEEHKVNNSSSKSSETNELHPSHAHNHVVNIEPTALQA